ncbi:hypothetical protein [Pontibacter amylolyticus]|nr:hypothetical protein [Pontibacter amylolyticus]
MCQDKKKGPPGQGKLQSNAGCYTCNSRRYKAIQLAIPIPIPEQEASL